MKRVWKLPGKLRQRIGNKDNVKKLDLNAVPTNLTCLTYGFSGSGKTHFASTWPKPRFLSDAFEKGWETTRNMDRTKFFDPTVMPEIIPIETPKDMMEAISETGKEGIGKSKDAPQTLIIDSLTFYADAFFEAVVKAQGAKVDTRGAYGDLLSHIRRLVLSTHALPINIVWLALAKAPEDGVSGIMLAGKSADKIPALCQYWLHARAFHNGKATQHEIRTRPFGQFPARCRDGGTLPEVLPEPTYKSFISELTKQPVVATK